MPGISRTMSNGRIITPTLQQIRKYAASHVDQFIQDPRIMKVKNKSGVVMPFRYTYSQLLMAKVIAEEHDKGIPVRLYILKSRQVGSSTFYLARYFALTWALNEVEAIIMAQQEIRAQELLERCKFFYQMLPDVLKLELAQDNKNGIMYADTRGKCTILSAKNFEAATGGTKQFAQLSEWPLYKHAMDVLEEFEQFIDRSPFTELILEGTGKGRGTQAHEFWNDCKSGRGDYRTVFLRWQDDPECVWRFNSDKERDYKLAEVLEYEPRLKDWMRHHKLSAGNIVYAADILRHRCKGNWDKFLVSHPADDVECWRAQGESFFGTDNINQIEVGDFAAEYRVWGVNNPLGQEFQDLEELEQIDKLDENGNRPFVKIWKRALLNRTYLISGDAAQGLEDGNSSSAFIIDTTTMEMMAEFHGKVRPDEFAYVLASLGNIYNGAMIAQEFNSPGNVTVNELSRRIFYPNLYVYRRLDDVKFRATRYLGWQTNSQTRPIMLALAKRIVEELAQGRVANSGIIKSRELLNEMATFLMPEDEIHPEAAPGCQDDRVMAWAIAITVAAQETYGSSLDIMSIYKTDPDKRDGNTVDPGMLKINPTDAIAKLQSNIYKERQLPEDYEEPFQWLKDRPPF